MFRSTTTIISLLAALATSGEAAYVLKQKYDASNFFNEFTFFTDSDPTEGFVQYVSASTAQSAGLARIINNNQVYLGVDNTTVIDKAGPGRKSVRLQSNQTFSNGVLIADFAHLPNNTCGTWPAYWTINLRGKPYGEIDIVEGVNDQAYDDVSLHTSNDCHLKGSTQTGRNNRPNCRLVTDDDDGCGVSGDSTSYGDGFNARKGGLYVLYLEDDALKVWLFLRDSIPADITAGNPDPSGWGTPLLDFESRFSGCEVARNFFRQTIIFNIDFCGENAGGEGWTDFSNCPKSTGVSTCEAYVAANPEAFSGSYFLINSLKLYQSSRREGRQENMGQSRGKLSGILLVVYILLWVLWV